MNISDKVKSALRKLKFIPSEQILNHFLPASNDSKKLKEMVVVFNEMYDFYHKKYKKVLAEIDNRSTAYHFGTMVEMKYDELAKSGDYQLACKSGCAHCCYQNVDITEHEAELLVGAIVEDHVKFDKDLLMVQSQSIPINELPHESRRCIFLTKENKCGVYQYRPIACRKYFVTGDPELCDSQKYPNGSVSIVTNTEAEVIASTVYDSIRTDSMAKMILKQLQHSNKK